MDRKAMLAAADEMQELKRKIEGIQVVIQMTQRLSKQRGISDEAVAAHVRLITVSEKEIAKLQGQMVAIAERFLPKKR